MYIDTHAHLNFKDFGLDYAQAIERAFKSGVKKIIIPGSSLDASKKAVKISNEFDGLYSAVGLHPTHLEDEHFDFASYLKLAKNKKVVAIGETGLDYHHEPVDKIGQQELLVEHIKLANLLNKPIILHSRNSAEDLLSILMSQANLPKGVMHCFSEGLNFAKVVTQMGFYISFTGIITFTKNQDTIEVISNIPLEKILIETDCPYLAPEPHRGERNEPAFVVEVAKKIAEIKKIPVEKVAEQTSENAQELFGI